MLNEDRIAQLTDLMTDRGWDFLLLYGHSWRKDFFRCLVNLNFSGPHAAAVLDRSGEVSVILSDPWDYETASAALNLPVLLEPDFDQGPGPFFRALQEFQSGDCRDGTHGGPLCRFCSARRSQQPVPATLEVEELRRCKTSDEIDMVKKAVELADRGYRYFADIIEAGMKEYELVAEVEAFLKSNGAEDNFMLIASGGTEVKGMAAPTDRRFQKGDSVITSPSNFGGPVGKRGILGQSPLHGDRVEFHRSG